jgi:hypothetical protein
MMTITEIKEAVSKFSPEEFKEFVEWLDELQEHLWDQQIELDLRSGKLDHLIEQAETSFREGKCREI